MLASLVVFLGLAAAPAPPAAPAKTASAPALTAPALTAPASAMTAMTVQETTPAPAAVRRVLVLDVDAVGVSADDAAAATRVIAAAAAEVEGVVVISTAELRKLAELEAERSAVGCTDSSCMAELAGALGAENVLFGSLSKLGDTTTATLSLYDSRSGQTERASLSVTNLSGLAPALTDRTRTLLGATARAHGVGLGFITATTGGVMALGGALVGGGAEGLLWFPKALPGDTRAVTRTVGVIGFAVAGAGVVVATAGLVLGALE